jgi:hypothetical protein
MTVNDVRAWIRKTATPEVLIAFVFGLVLGLVVLGWWVWPVQWINADPADLRTSHQDTYLQMIADSFALNGNNELALARLEGLKKPGQKDTELTAMIMSAAQERLQAGQVEDAGRLQRLATALNLPAPASQPPSGQPAGTGATSNWLRILGILFFLGLLGAGLLLLLTQLQRREPARRRRPPRGAGDSYARLPEEEPQPVGPPSPEGAFAQFETAYQIGDEAYDVSYSIESATGEFLGECGVSALEKESGTPGKFTAFDIWLFDKLDSRTETKVLMSERAFADEALRAKLTDRREFVQAEKGKIVTLETENLHLYATVTDVEYEAGSESGVFASLATRLEIVPKERTT